MSKKNPITVSSWTLGDQCKFEDRVIAAKEAGYEGIGLRAETYVDALNEGLHDEDILAILDKHDMKVTEVEYIVQWCEEHRSYEQKYKEQMCFHMCELFGVGHINCGLMENYSVEYTAQKLKELCQRAGKYIIVLMLLMALQVCIRLVTAASMEMIALTTPSCCVNLVLCR